MSQRHAFYPNPRKQTPLFCVRSSRRDSLVKAIHHLLDPDSFPEAFRTHLRRGVWTLSKLHLPGFYRPKICAVPTVNRRKLGCPKGCCGRNIECPCKTNHRLDFWATDQAYLHARARASPPGKQKKRKHKLAVSHGCLKEGRRWGFALAVVGGQPQLHGLRIQPSGKKGPKLVDATNASHVPNPDQIASSAPKFDSDMMTRKPHGIRP